ncbi:hypothetical protein [Massilia antarctica]|uniref:hypothetical protein n=1 Tax=Massilia antarctica TaxID=2765360 RepID=UPI00226FC53F|nr:hypothetical protein [Massilia sp. H27-R4]MCY0914031.1 hypothetical protein [Massilia sp. H27-R4]
MDIVKDLKDALKAVEAAKNSLGGELHKGGDLPWAYNQLQTAEQKIKRVIQTLPK